MIPAAGCYLLSQLSYFSELCLVAAACRSSSSLARSGLPLLEKHCARWEALERCGAAGSPLLHMASTWKAWVATSSPARRFTSWAVLRRRRREGTSRATSSSESSAESQRRRESDRESGGWATDGCKRQVRLRMCSKKFLVHWFISNFHHSWFGKEKKIYRHRGQYD